jgi:hypothetical protein
VAVVVVVAAAVAVAVAVALTQPDLQKPQNLQNVKKIMVTQGTGLVTPVENLALALALAVILARGLRRCILQVVMSLPIAKVMLI